MMKEERIDKESFSQNSTLSDYSDLDNCLNNTQVLDSLNSKKSKLLNKKRKRKMKKQNK